MKTKNFPCSRRLSLDISTLWFKVLLWHFKCLWVFMMSSLVSSFTYIDFPSMFSGKSLVKAIWILYKNEIILLPTRGSILTGVNLICSPTAHTWCFFLPFPLQECIWLSWCDQSCIKRPYSSSLSLVTKSNVSWGLDARAGSLASTVADPVMIGLSSAYCKIFTGQWKNWLTCGV